MTRKIIKARASPRAELLSMLTYARPHGSDAELAFVNRYVDTLPGISWDKFGNGWVQVNTSPILWSCHTDTVHHKPGRQKILVNNKNIAGLAPEDSHRGMCLGADDAAGVWLMRQMILAGVGGRYVFHAGEEHGGLGSAWIARERKDLLTGIDYAIALDRKGTSSIITHQVGGRCASEAFSASLAAKLGGGWKSDDTGTFTDTANYVDLIGECTNLSVGYYSQHSHNETLDVGFLMSLRRKLLRFDATGLVAKRQPGEKEQLPLLTYNSSWSQKPTKTKYDHLFNYDEPYQDNEEPDASLVEFCEDRPALAARLIEKLGGNLSDAIEILFESEPETK